MRNLNKKWITLVELMMVIAIGWVLLTGAGMAGWNVYQNSIDNGIRGDLKALSNATTAFMTDTNGIAPCFTPLAVEWVAPASGHCLTSGYDYIQWRVQDTVSTWTVWVTDWKWFNLDYDSVGWELFTPNNILVPTYIEALPDPRRSGQSYYYTKGSNTTAEANTSFAYSSLLSWPKAQDTLNENVSVLNVSWVGWVENTDRRKVCTPAEVSPVTNGWTKLTAVAGVDDDTKLYTYYEYPELISANAWNKLVVADPTDATEACDLFSDGQWVRNGNFTNTLTTINVNN